MYTGVVEELGKISQIEVAQNGCRLDIEMETSSIKPGDSFAVNGVCLTAVEVNGDSATVELSEETVDRSYLADLSAGSPVNIERPLSVEDTLDGHIVKGTIDTTTQITDIHKSPDDWQFTFAIPEDLDRYVVEKGAVALDGASLTVGNVDSAGDQFTVSVVLETYNRTILSDKEIGDPVHFEADILAKYVQQGPEVAADL